MRITTWLTRCLLALIAVISTQLAHALTIEGLRPFESLLLRNVNASATGGKLEVRYPKGYLSIQPWPDFLPARMTNQVVRAERQIWPAGPSDLVAFTRVNEKTSWLIIGSQSRSATHLVGNWSLQFIDGDWYVTNGTRKIYLPATATRNNMICILAANANWYVYPLNDINKELHQAGTAEYEPRISWIALRSDSCNKR
jgi:hypothetical protein